MAKSTSASKSAPKPMPKAFRIVRNHRRLFLSAAIGVVLLAASLLADWRMTTRLLVCWDVGVVLYLGQAFALVRRFDERAARRRTADQDEGALLVLIITLAAAAASLGAIIAEIGGAGHDKSTAGLSLILAIITIALSWTLIHMIFAFHYAHEFYGEGRDKKHGGLQFPGSTNSPDYWDFVYFSFVIGMTFQVSDVQITSKAIRHVALAHALASFVFDVAILALVVNLGSNIINS